MCFPLSFHESISETRSCWIVVEATFGKRVQGFYSFGSLGFISRLNSGLRLKHYNTHFNRRAGQLCPQISLNNFPWYHHRIMTCLSTFWYHHRMMTCLSTFWYHHRMMTCLSNFWYHHRMMTYLSNFWLRIAILCLSTSHYITKWHSTANRLTSLCDKFALLLQFPWKQRELSGCERLYRTYCGPCRWLQTGNIQPCGNRRWPLGLRA
jgi:hypothetical protein